MDHFFLLCFDFIRIDVSQNDLPWESMTDRLPTILFFPYHRKDLSVKFPEDILITLPNLLKFILHHSSLPSPVSEPCTKKCLQKETVLQQGHISHLEKEINKLRLEISALHQVQGQLEAQLSETRREEERLQQQKHILEKHRSTLELHRDQLQELYEQKSRELEEMAEKLQELADASENLLTENTLLKVLVASLETKLHNTGKVEKSMQVEERLPNEAIGSVATTTDSLHEEKLNVASIETTMTSEHSKEKNRTE
uniref:Uncharacterized protein n=1 Tax=Sphenodon punctatus TaxID=8508 RepID=A0A8D0GLM1_SPHPU